MTLSRGLPQTKDSDLAKNVAIWTTLSFIGFGFAFPNLMIWLASLFPQGTPEPIKTLAIGGGITLLSWGAVSAVVGSAIDAAKKVGIKEYEDKNPEIAETRKKQETEYCCAIPLGQRSQESIEGTNPIPDFCKRRAGRDAVIRGLAYNDELLDDISTKATNSALIELKIHKTTTSNDYHMLRNDIYAYLKAWLMFSVAHDHIMPVKYIKQRFPLKTAYTKAIENVGKQIETYTVVKFLDERYRHEANSILHQYLDQLVKEIGDN